MATAPLGARRYKSLDGIFDMLLTQLDMPAARYVCSANEGLILGEPWSCFAFGGAALSFCPGFSILLNKLPTNVKKYVIAIDKDRRVVV